MIFDGIKFGSKTLEVSEGQGCLLRAYSDVLEREYFSFLGSLFKMGYRKTEERNIKNNCFSFFTNGESDLYFSYYGDLKEVRAVCEPHSGYFDFHDEYGTGKVQPLMTQIDLEDFGESVVFRLSDGRFIVFDGGREFEPDADKLMECLISQSVLETPTVAAWILTHPHIDHYSGFFIAEEKYRGKFKVENIIFNFPDAGDDDIKRIPGMEKERERLKRFYSSIAETGAAVYKAHTGQVFKVGDAVMEMLFTPDDIVDSFIEDINTISLVVKLTLANQCIMMCADAYLPLAHLAEKFGDYLKCDILQPAHHMFIGGDVDTYELMDPRVVVVPSFEYDVFKRISPYQNICKKENLFLFYDLNVEDFFTGATGNVVLKLPYEPRKNGRELYLQKIESYKKSLGDKSWVFFDVPKDEADFTFLNLSAECAEVYADLYFDERSDLIFNIKIEVPTLQNYKVNLFDSQLCDPDALYYNPHSFKKKGLPECESFTVNFRSDIPIVIKGKKSADYHG